MPSDHLVLCHPLLLPLIFPSIRVFSDELAFRHQVAKVLEFQLQTRTFLVPWRAPTELQELQAVSTAKISERMTLTKQP